MKNKFNLQALLISCLATFILSVAVNNDANTFVAAPFQPIQEKLADESSQESPSSSAQSFKKKQLRPLQPLNSLQLLQVRVQVRLKK
ncbi:hypothetical protein [Tetragenococcus muriaticus]|uniref:hypothetical protein n=1 Tax=Tetragenococcus muriaticus TaxID=64642 RepID=UPI00056F227A|nr:hypothetical protein [Tetragenococcus muriaticus]